MTAVISWARFCVTCDEFITDGELVLEVRRARVDDDITTTERTNKLAHAYHLEASQ